MLLLLRFCGQMQDLLLWNNETSEREKKERRAADSFVSISPTPPPQPLFPPATTPITTTLCHPLKAGKDSSFSRKCAIFFRFAITAGDVFGERRKRKKKIK
ncbi:hypothetical protein CDAR_117021 [Caerostris darwini]|uniref:Uncharacterized protein n=1 Tax=Caerostris darwini TaxID=1538125 RepID=A0AAV4W8Q2_9ARAC|nr:hypothetical protein CDAR_117021 [Caerostris darwini]